MNYGDHYQRKNNHKVIGLIKDELYGKIMTELAASRPKAYSYLTDDSDKKKKEKKKKKKKKKKSTKRCVMKRKLKFEYYRYYLEATHLQN